LSTIAKAAPGRLALSSVDNSGSGRPGMIMPVGGRVCTPPSGKDDPGQAQNAAASGQPPR
jgi:hypothetical protein